jgi:hypothetical protein
MSHPIKSHSPGLITDWKRFRPSQKVGHTITSRTLECWNATPGERCLYLANLANGPIEKLLEAWEIAPMPQFRLSQPSHPKKTPNQLPNIPTPAIVCSLRTILPKTVPNEADDGKYHDGRQPAHDNPREPGPPQPPPNLPVERDAEKKFRFHHELNPSASALQKNVAANRTMKEHTIAWTCEDNINPEAVEAKALEDVGRGRETGTGEIVRNMKAGDVITVWAKARYGGWVNYVDEVKIDVYWAV